MVVITGVCPSVHLAAAGHVTVLPPLPSCIKITVKYCAVPLAGGLENVKVVFPPLLVCWKMFELARLRSTVPEVLVTTTVSVMAFNFVFKVLSLALNKKLVLLLAVVLLPRVLTNTGYSAAVLVSLEALIVVLGPADPAYPSGPMGPIGPIGPIGP